MFLQEFLCTSKYAQLILTNYNSSNLIHLFMLLLQRKYTGRKGQYTNINFVLFHDTQINQTACSDLHNFYCQ